MELIFFYKEFKKYFYYVSDLVTQSIEFIWMVYDWMEAPIYCRERSDLKELSQNIVTLYEFLKE